MLDLLYPGESLHAAATAKGSGLSARRAGRAALRTEVLRRYAGESVAETADDGIPVRIAPDVLEKMEERHILREDAVRVVRHAEASGDTFLNRDNGHFLASLRPVRVTFWVEYSVRTACVSSMTPTVTGWKCPAHRPQKAVTRLSATRSTFRECRRRDMGGCRPQPR